MNGEMSFENVEIFYFYGCIFFKVGQSKLDVLGGSVLQVKNQVKFKVFKKKIVVVNGVKNGEGSFFFVVVKVGEKVEKVVVEVVGKEVEKELGVEIKKFMFYFEGDENFVDFDEEEEEGEEGEGEEEEEDDDFVIVFEIFDLVCVFFFKKFEVLQVESEGKGKEVVEEGSDNFNICYLKECLGDIYDFFVEILFENEKYVFLLLFFI